MKTSVTKKDGLIYKILELILYCITIYYSYYVSLKLDMFDGYKIHNYDAFYSTIPFILLFSIVILMSIGLFRTVNKSKVENFSIVLIGTSLIMVTYMAVAFFSRDFGMPRTVILMSFMIQTVVFFLIKIIFIKIVRFRKGIRKIVIFGSEEEKEKLVSKIYSGNIYKEELSYYIDPMIVDNFKMYINKSDKIYVSDLIQSEIKDRIITHCISTNKSLYIIPKTFEIAIFNSKLVQVSDIPMFRIESLHLSREKLIVKRCFDLLLAIPITVILMPIMLIIALAILISEGRPIIFTQERVTINNRKFQLYKFRSMHKDAEKNSGAIWAIRNDPRVTRLGKFLRKFWLDELPQLINVIKGDMSLVGPRPERPIFINEFSKAIPDFHYRLSVKAGVTGLAQVLGKYATTPELKIKFDILYIKNTSVLFDLKIIIETVKKIIVGTLKRGENIDLTYEEVLERHNLKENTKNGRTIYKNKR